MGYRFQFRYQIDGEGMACDGLPFPGTGCPVPGVGNDYFCMKWLMYGKLLLHLATSIGSFCPSTFFSNKELDNLPWTSFIWDTQTKLRVISRGVPGLITDFPCVWGRGWTTCPQYGSPLSGLCFKWELVCKFVTLMTNFLLIFLLFVHYPSFAYYFFPLKCFNSQITIFH